MSVGLHILQHSLILYIFSIGYPLQISQPTSAAMRPDQRPLKTGEQQATSVLSGLWTWAHGADIRSPFLLGTSVCVCGERTSQKMRMCCIFSLLRSLGACLAFKCIDSTPRLPNAITNLSLPAPLAFILC